jgi:putative NADH-flavin reductase
MVSKIAIIGANGKVASKLIQRLANLKNEFETTAFIRNEAQAPKFEALGIKYSLDIDITSTKLSAIAKSLKGYDAVIFSAGAAGQGLDLTFSVDLDGAVKVSEAVKAAGIDRFILVSAIKSQDREYWWDTPLRSYYIAKKYADDVISKSDINWTILQPGALLDTESTGKVYPIAEVDQAAESKSTKIEISRDDVALAIIESLRNRSTVKRFIPLVSGDVPIAEALQKL